jgi:hydrogenase expression/formation protein HypC
MCLAIPGKVEAITNDGIIRMGKVNFGGVVKNVCLDYVPEVEVGDYTIVHVGFAISKIDEQTAQQTLADFRALGVLDEELGSEEEAFARAAQRPQSNCPDGSCDAASQLDSKSAGRPSRAPKSGPGAPIPSGLAQE